MFLFLHVSTVGGRESCCQDHGPGKRLYKGILEIWAHWLYIGYMGILVLSYIGYTDMWVIWLCRMCGYVVFFHVSAVEQEGVYWGHRWWVQSSSWTSISKEEADFASPC